MVIMIIMEKDDNADGEDEILMHNYGDDEDEENTAEW